MVFLLSDSLCGLKKHYIGSGLRKSSINLGGLGIIGSYIHRSCVFASSTAKSPLMDANETKMEFNIGRKSPMYVVVLRISAESRS